MSDGLRRRNVEIDEEPKIDFYEKIKTLDAFTKVAEEAEGEKTVTGGFFSFLAFSVMTILFVCEIWIWVFHTNFKYEFDVDVDFKDKLNLNFDITVNSPCFGIGAGMSSVSAQNYGQNVQNFLDIIDSSGDAWRYMVQINEETGHFDLSDTEEALRIKHLDLKDKLYEDG